ncbi:thioredoxin family protein [Hyphobacterium sp. CCMP332]|nr:thioredoxin family protein [Hyphobacterium sp. CCMP332]
MSLTDSNMMPLKTGAPEFEIINTLDQKKYTFESLKGDKGTLVYFICNHCPYVIHVINELVKISKVYEKRGIKTIAISSNDIEKYPEDSPEKMKQFAEVHRFAFPYLFDETQQVAKAYYAACTPDLYLFDANDKCFYRGRLDEARPGNDKPVDGKDLRNALEQLLNGKTPPMDQFPSAGCNIKWK